MYPHLAQMARVTFAVPSTRAGVEREFRKSGHVATRTRSQLKPDTICETMRYKAYLTRIGEQLTRAKSMQNI